LPFVFQISDGEVEYNSGAEVYRFSVGLDLAAVVAVSTFGQTYLIRAGHGSLGEFQRLAHDYRVSIDSGDMARRYLEWYLAVNPENFSFTKIDSPQQLKEEAERKFMSMYSSAVLASASFDNWWLRHFPKVGRLGYGEQITSKSNRYTVSFYTLSEIDRKHIENGPQLVRITLDFGADGEVIGWRSKRVG
jgi:hypothetical protein